MTKRLQFRQPRIPARHSRLGAALVYRALIRPALRRMFDRILVHYAWDWAAEGPNLQTATPVLCYATHPSWWDGYLAAELFRARFPRQTFLMMEEAQLQRYFFFRWLGCFSVDRHDPREALRSIRYAAEQLQTKRKPLVWIFPQGEIQPSDRRPLVLYSGAAEIAIRTDGVWCVPVALRYEFGEEQRPLALINLGRPRWVDRSCERAEVQHHFEQDLFKTTEELRTLWNQGRLQQFETLLQGRPSTNVVFDQILGPVVKRFWKDGRVK